MPSFADKVRNVLSGKSSDGEASPLLAAMSSGADPLKEQRAFMMAYITSPKYRARLVKQGYKNPDQTIKERLASMRKMGYVPNPYVATQYMKDENVVVYNDDEVKGIGFIPNTTKLHEMSHGAGALEPGYGKGNMALNQNEVMQLQHRNKLSTVNPNNYPVDQMLNILHDRKPSEAKADMDALRFQLKRDGIYNTGTQEFTPELLKKAKSKYAKDPALNRLFTNFSDKDLIYLMNNIAMLDHGTTGATMA